MPDEARRHSGGVPRQFFCVSWGLKFPRRTTLVKEGLIVFCKKIETDIGQERLPEATRRKILFNVYEK